MKNLNFLSNSLGDGRKFGENRAFTPFRRPVFLPKPPNPPFLLPLRRSCGDSEWIKLSWSSSKLGSGTVTGGSVVRGGGGVVCGLGSRREAVVTGGSGGL